MCETTYPVNLILFLVKEWAMSSIALPDTQDKGDCVNHFMEQCLDEVLPGTQLQQRFTQTDYNRPSEGVLTKVADSSAVEHLLAPLDLHAFQLALEKLVVEAPEHNSNIGRGVQVLPVIVDQVSRLV